MAKAVSVNVNSANNAAVAKKDRHDGGHAEPGSG